MKVGVGAWDGTKLKADAALAAKRPAETIAAAADRGAAEANLTEADPAGPELLIAPNNDWQQRQALREPPPPDGRVGVRINQECPGL